MAEVYWFGNGGNWSDHTNHWSNNSGNSPASLHGAAPGADDNANFDANSFSSGSQTVTVDVDATCLAMTWTGATNTPELAIAATRYIDIRGGATFIAAMSVTGDRPIVLAGNLTTNGLDLTGINYIQLGGNLVFLDDLTTTKITQGAYTVTTNNNTINIDNWEMYGATAKTVTLGASIVNTTGALGWRYTGSNLTLTANTATINIAGTGAFVGGGIATYNIVNLTGSAHTVSGSNTFATFALPSGTTQTITFTDGTTQTAAAFTLSGDATHQHTLTGSSTAGWALVKSGGGNVVCDYLSVSYSTVS